MFIHIPFSEKKFAKKSRKIAQKTKTTGLQLATNMGGAGTPCKQGLSV
jgi:hypothetical protein